MDSDLLLFLKDTPLDKKTSVTINSHSKDLDANSTVITSPVRHVINLSGENTQLEKSSSANLINDTAENVRNTMGLNAANDDELIRLDQAATKAQAAFRGYLVCFWNLIICFFKIKCYVAFLYVIFTKKKTCEGFKLLLTKYVFLEILFHSCISFQSYVMNSHLALCLVY